MTGGVAGTGIDEEAEDDARMLREAGRWQQPLANQPLADPLAGLSEDEKRRRVLEYFERKRAVEAGFPYSPPASANPLSGFVPSTSTPPAAGSGIYTSLLDEAGRTPQPPPVPTDFSGLEPEEGVELTAKTELQ